MPNSSNGWFAHLRGRVIVMIPVIFLLAAPIAVASEAPRGGPSLEELRAGADRFARIFEGIGAYPGSLSRGKVTLPPPTLPPGPQLTPGHPTIEDLAWSSRFSLPAFDDHITAIVQHRGHWIAAGYFGAAPGTSAHGIAEWDGVRWRDLATNIRGMTYALASDGTTLYAGGSYRVELNGVRTHLGVLRWDGERWLPLGSPDLGLVRALRVIRGSLYAAGQLRIPATPGSQPVARWAGDEWETVGPALAGAATAVVEHEGKLTLAGFFASGPPDYDYSNHVVSLEPSGWKVLASRDSAYSSLNAIESFGGRLWVGGSLQGFQGISGGAVAVWDGASWSASNLGGYVTSLVVSGGKLWAGGALVLPDGGSGVQPGGVASLEGDHWAVPADAPRGRIFALASTAGRPGMAGDFPSDFYRTLDPNDPGNTAITVAGRAVVVERAGEWSSLAPPALSEAGLATFSGALAVVRLDLLEGELWASGWFDFKRDRGAWSLLPGFARWDNGGWIAPTQPGSGGASLPGQLIKFGGVVYAAYPYGSFGIFGSLYRLGAGGWEAVPGAPEQGVTSLATYQGSLVVAGHFTQAGGAPAASIARYDGASWAPLGDASVAISAPELVPSFTTLLADGAELWAAGSFPAGGGVPGSGVARWDGALWHAAGAGLQGNVDVLATYRGALVAGGDFQYSGSEFTGGLASWDGAAWHRVGPEPVLAVTALAEARGSLYAGGSFGRTISSPGIARFDGERWTALGSGLRMGDRPYADVRSIVPVGDELWVSGRFSMAGGKPAYSVATWNLRTASFGSPSISAATAGIKAASATGKTGTRISFSIERGGLAELGVYDVRGARVGTVARERFTAGTHEVEWNGRDASGAAVAPGVYFLQLRVDGVVVASGRTVALR